MCVEKIQRIMTALMLSLVLILFSYGLIMAATFLQGFIIIMMFIWAVFDFCPALALLGKFLPPCKPKS